MASALGFPLPLAPTILGSSFVGLGLYRLFSPREAYGLFGLPLPPSSIPGSEPSPFIYANGGRDLTIGLAYFLFAGQRNHEAVKALTLACIVRNGELWFLSQNRSKIFSRFPFCDSFLLLLTHLPLP